MTTPNGFRAESNRNPDGLRTPRARAHSIATYRASDNATRDVVPIHLQTVPAERRREPLPIAATRHSLPNDGCGLTPGDRR